MTVGWRRNVIISFLSSSYPASRTEEDRGHCRGSPSLCQANHCSIPLQSTAIHCNPLQLYFVVFNTLSTLLHCTVIHCSVLHDTELLCMNCERTALLCIAQHYAVFAHCTAVHSIALQALPKPFLDLSLL